MLYHLLLHEYFPELSLDLESNPDHSKIYSERRHDITHQYFCFVEELLRLNGVIMPATSKSREKYLKEPFMNPCTRAPKNL